MMLCLQREQCMINNLMNSCTELKLNGVLQAYQSIADEAAKISASYTESTATGTQSSGYGAQTSWISHIKDTGNV